MKNKEDNKEFLIAYCPIEYYSNKEMKQMGWINIGDGWSKDGTSGGARHTGEKEVQLSWVLMKLRNELFPDVIAYRTGIYQVVMIVPSDTDSRIKRYKELLDEAEQICKDKYITYKRFEVVDESEVI